MTDKSKSFDAHCHVFNHDVLKVRLVAVLTTLLSELEETSSLTSRIIYVKKRRENIRSILEKIQVFIRVLFSTSESVFRLLKRKYKKMESDKDFCYIPLMFDSEFSVTIDKNTGKDPFIDMLEILDMRLQDLKGKHVKLCTNRFFQRFDIQLAFLSSMVVPKLKEIHERKAKGYVEQLEAIIEIKRKYPDSVFPFLGVDPRRVGIVALVKKYFDSGDKLFSGIKLYAPNGFSPMDPRLFEIYSYCESNGIPITAHSSYGGFATLDNEVEIYGYYFNQVPIKVDGLVKFKVPVFNSGWIEDRAYTLNHPQLWSMVLKNYPNLKLNLAHFGVRARANSDDKIFEWSGMIVELMKSYKNLYTDLSCFTTLNELKKAKNSFLNQPLTDSEKVIDRVMYGSDFFLNLFFIDTFENYYKNFFNRGVFNSKEIQQICNDNPYRFLFGGQKKDQIQV